MSTIFEIEMLPARQGDCLWISYGEREKLNYILIDGGTKGTYNSIKKKIESLNPADRHLELLVITHIDADHIEGILKLFQDEQFDISVDEIWFNGWKHISDNDFETFGPVQGEKLTELLINQNRQWNQKFNGKAVCIGEQDELPSKLFDGGIKLTLLSPDQNKLTKLIPVWEKICTEEGLKPGVPAVERITSNNYEVMGPLDVEELCEETFEYDKTEANGSSIAILAEFDGRSILLAGDSHPDIIAQSIDRLLYNNVGKLKLNALKMPHHGSKANINADILDKISCDKYLFSTNGAYHNHPDKEAVACVIKNGGDSIKLYFNYSTKQNLIWDDEILKNKYNYETCYPEDNESGIVIDL